MGFYHGLSGLNASSKSLDVIGHNIANSNTTGFKSSRAEFNEMVASAMGASSGNNAGIGVSVAAVSQQFSQGVITPTNNGLDMAINGDGFFVVNTSSGMAYTRSGSFQLNKSGDLVTVNGDQVMGYKLDPATGNITSLTTTPLSFPTGAPIAAKQTSSIAAVLNLDARAPLAAGDSTATPPISPTPRATYGTSVNIYDAQGVATPTSVYFEKVGANTWAIYDGLDNPNATPPVFNAPVGFAIMNGDGSLKAIAQPSPPPSNPITDAANLPASFTYTYLDSAATDPNEKYVTETMDVTWTPVTTAGVFQSASFSTAVDTAATTKAATGTVSTALALQVDNSKTNPNSPTPGAVPVSLDLSKATQYGTGYSVAKLTQDGYTSGELTGVNVSGDGKLVATYSNGVSRAEAQLQLVRFNNAQGLSPAGNNNWVWTADAGPVIEGKAGDSGFGSIQGNALEQSNVDLTAELVNMMTAQRAYQANAQTIKTQDQIFSTLVNLR